MLEDIRRDLENWLGETEYASVRMADPEALARRFPRALSADSEQAAEDAVTAAEAKGDAAILRRHRALRAGIAWTRLRGAEREAVALAEDGIARSKAKLPDGTTLGWTALRQMRDRAPVRQARVAAEQALASAADSASEGRLEVFRWRREEAQRRGARDERGVFERLEGINLAGLAAEARRFLETTRDAYRANLDWLLKRHDSSRDTAAAHDIAWARFEIRRTIPAPRDRMLQVLDGALKSMGLDPTASGRLHRGVAPDPPGVVARRRVPGDIHVLLHLDDGVPALAEELSGWGRALAAAWTPANLPMEDRVLGDPAVPLAWGALFSLAPLESDWIARTLDFARPKDAARELQVLDLAAVRRLAGMLDAEIDQVTGSSAEESAERVRTAICASCPASLLRNEVSPWFGTAHRLRAAAAAASLANLLESRFGNWHRDPETGKFLLQAWSLGRQCSAGDLPEKLGAEKDAFGAMAKRFLQRLA